MVSLKQLQDERAEAQENIGVCVEYLKIEPGDPDTLTMKASLEQQVKDLDEKIAAESANQEVDGSSAMLRAEKPGPQRYIQAFGKSISSAIL